MGSEVQILSGAITMIIQVFPAGPYATNAVLLGCQKTRLAVIIDFPRDSVEMLDQALNKQGLTLQMMLLTHSHWDHIADAAEAKRRWNVPLYVHEEDAANLESPGADGLPLMFPIEGVKADHFLKDGQQLEVGQLKIEVIHTPGHTPGGVCFWLKENELLISGDTLFKGTMGNLSFPTSRPKLMWDSLKKLALLPAETRVLPGHGEETSIGAERWMAQAQKIFER